MSELRTRSIGALVAGLFALGGALLAVPGRGQAEILLIVTAAVAAAVVGWLLGRFAVRPGVASGLVVLVVGTFGALPWGFLLVATLFALAGDLGIEGSMSGTPGEILYGAVVFALPWLMVAEVGALVWVAVVRVLARALPAGHASRPAGA